MGLKNSPKISEELAICVDVEKLSAFVAFGNEMKQKGLGDFSEDVKKAIEAIKLATEGVIYVFSVEDSWDREKGSGNGNGVQLYRRIGNNLVRVLSWEQIGHIPYLFEVVHFLIQNKVKQIVTGSIKGSFLGVNAFTKDEDEDTISISVLDEGSIEEIRKNGIEVVVLDELV